MNDNKVLELACKEMLMKIVKESKTLDKKLNFYQKILLLDKIKEMSYPTVVNLLFNEQDDVDAKKLPEYENKIKKSAKYGAAGYLGRKVGQKTIDRAVSGKEVKVFGKEIIKKRKTIKDLENLRKQLFSKIEKIENKKLSEKLKNQLKKVDLKLEKIKTKQIAKINPSAISKAKTGLGTGVVKHKGKLGILGGVGALYLYRRLSDPCVRKNIGNKEGQNLCKIMAVEKVISNIKSDISNCKKAKNPEKCKKILYNSLQTWENRLANLKKGA